MIGGDTAVFSLAFGGAIAAHAGLAVLALWLFKKALPTRAEAPAAAEAAKPGAD